jgi:hypothetical protein
LGGGGGLASGHIIAPRSSLAPCNSRATSGAANASVFNDVSIDGFGGAILGRLWLCGYPRHPTPLVSCLNKVPLPQG